MGANAEPRVSRPGRADGAGNGIRTPEDVRQQIYSLPPLAAWVSPRLLPRPLPPVPNRLISLALAGGFEPPTHCLQGSCSTPELRQQSQNFTLVSRPFQVKTFLLETFRQGPGRLLWSPAGAKLRSRERPPRPRRSTTRSSLS